MPKHLVDIDETALASAQAESGTTSMKETVNEALKRAGAGRNAKVSEALAEVTGQQCPRVVPAGTID